MGLLDQPARLVRLTRAEPPGLAESDDGRRAIYGAALQQFEELLAAAAAVSPISRPLPLFYALSQAGRAIVAAYGDNPEVGSHGLAEVRGTAPTDARRLQIKATGGPNGAFAAVAAATSAEPFLGAVELGALWASVSERTYMPSEGWDRKWRPSLMVVGHGHPMWRTERCRLFLPHLAPSLDDLDIVVNAGTYPTLPRVADTWREPKTPKPHLDVGDYVATAEWYLDRGDVFTSRSHALPRRAADPSGREWLMPALGDNRAALSPLMAWWALLFGFSVLARYHPGLWTSALNPDRSKLAVPLESLLDEALAVVPALVLEPLFGNSVASPNATLTAAAERLLGEAQERLDGLYGECDAFHGPLPEPVRRKGR